MTGLETAAIEAGLLPVLPALTQRHRVVLASAATSDGGPWHSAAATDAVPRGDAAPSGADEPPADAFELAAFLRSELDRAAISAELGRLGVSVIDAPGEQLAPRLADRYLELKSSGQL